MENVTTIKNKVQINSVYALEKGSFAGSLVFVTGIENGITSFTIQSGLMSGAKKTMKSSSFNSSIRTNFGKRKKRSRKNH